MSKDKRTGSKRADATDQSLAALTPETLSQLRDAAAMEFVERPEPDASMRRPEPEKPRGLSEQLARAAAATANLALPDRSIAEGIRVAQAFKEQGGADVAEQILEQLVSGEVPVALELENIEGALVALLQRTVVEPHLFLKVAESFRETVATSAAIRRRIQNSLSAAAGLRAQRRMLNGVGNGYKNGK
jgi:hypothetical protein